MCKGKWFPAFQGIVLSHLQWERTTSSCRWKHSLFIIRNNSTNTASHSRRTDSSKNTVLNRTNTHHTTKLSMTGKRSYLNSTMCNGEQFTELYVKGTLTFRHRASCILGQVFRYSPENAFYIFNQQIY